MVSLRQILKRRISGKFVQGELHVGRMQNMPFWILLFDDSVIEQIGTKLFSRGLLNHDMNENMTWNTNLL